MSSLNMSVIATFPHPYSNREIIYFSFYGTSVCLATGDPIINQQHESEEVKIAEKTTEATTTTTNSLLVPLLLPACLPVRVSMSECRFTDRSEQQY